MNILDLRLVKKSKVEYDLYDSTYDYTCICYFTLHRRVFVC